MAKLLKVTVTGFENCEFIGTDKQVEDFLLSLKKKQEAEYDQVDLKWYKKEMPKYNTTFHQTCAIGLSTKYNFYSEKYRKPDFKMEKFRETQKAKGLTIKIESYELPE